METPGADEAVAPPVFISTIEMAQALGFTQVIGKRQSYEKTYEKVLPPSDGPTGSVRLDSGYYGDEEEMILGVTLSPNNKLRDIGNLGDSAFLDMLKESGVDEEAIAAVQQLPKGERGFKRKDLAAGGYNKLAQLLTALEQTTVYPTELAKIKEVIDKKRAFYDSLSDLLRAEFPQYDTTYASLISDDRLLLANSKKQNKRKRFPAMSYSYSENPKGNFLEFQIGTADIDTSEDGEHVISKFIAVYPVLKSTGKYPQRVFTGPVEEIIPASIAARRAILDELGK